MRYLRLSGDHRPGRRAPAWSTLQRTPVPINWTVTARTAGAVADRGEASLGDDAPAEEAAVGVVEGAGLSRRDGAHRLREVEREGALADIQDAAWDRPGPVPALHIDAVAGRERLGEPVHLGERDRVAVQRVGGADHDFPRLGADLHHVHR